MQSRKVGWTPNQTYVEKRRSRRLGAGIWKDGSEPERDILPMPTPRKRNRDAEDTGAGKPKQGEALYLNGTVRGGQVIKHHGTVVVVGDVNKEAAVVAGKDVVVWGALRGEAHAGCHGNEPTATILALIMNPTHLKIGNATAIGPGGAPVDYPEIASLSESGAIRIQPARRVGAEKAGIQKAGIAGSNRKGWKDTTFSAAGKAALFTGAYIGLVGLALMIAPVTCFGVLFDTRVISSGWIRVFGVLCTLFGVYYAGTAVGERVGAGARSFYVSTVVGRYFLFVSFLVMVWLRKIEPNLLILGFINLASATSMLSALRRPANTQEG
uniref:Septum formation inhibitor MinC C-terminal domain-containing protein n=1 Tax=Picocystis salinarum TaxID=88271 RepID=A0A7S3XCQ5_9CHLO|mmetsp:Transcript_1022/g.6450  ORF Transcript_1022/g.6450 Transcript_1022/m.6450 type:complete len:325 (+) Transcript_1022:206-1180(+)